MNQKVLVLILISLNSISSQFVDLDDKNKTIERPYCFRLTWLGPKYNEESQFKNATCGDLVKDKNVPCTHPLVVTSWVSFNINNIWRSDKPASADHFVYFSHRLDNSNIPDTDYIWNEYRNRPSEISCRLVKGEVCAKFSYTFNGASEFYPALSKTGKVLNLNALRFHTKQSLQSKTSLTCVQKLTSRTKQPFKMDASSKWKTGMRSRFAFVNHGLEEFRATIATSFMLIISCWL